jgi:hypothetical protein
MKGTWQTTDGGGLGDAVAAVVVVLVVVAVAGPVLGAVAAAVAELVHVLLIAAAVIVGVGAAGLAGLLTWRWRPLAGRRGPRHAPALSESGAGRSAAPSAAARDRTGARGPPALARRDPGGDRRHPQPPGQTAVNRAGGQRVSITARDGGGARPGPGTIPAASPGEPAAPPARPIAGRQIMHEYHGQHISGRRWARRSGLTLAWLAMLVLLAMAAAAVVIAAYRGGAR